VRGKGLLIAFLSFFFVFAGAQWRIQDLDVSFFPRVSFSLEGELLAENEFQLEEDGKLVASPVRFTALEQEEQKPLDVVFVVDLSYSMRQELQVLSLELQKVMDFFVEREVNARLGWVGFSDTIQQVFDPFSDPNESGKDPEKFKLAIQNFSGQTFGGAEECQMRALQVGAEFLFRENSERIIVLLTDEDTTDNATENTAVFQRLLPLLERQKIRVFSIISEIEPDPLYEQLAKETGGEQFLFYPDLSLEDQYSAFEGKVSIHQALQTFFSGLFSVIPMRYRVVFDSQSLPGMPHTLSVSSPGSSSASVSYTVSPSPQVSGIIGVDKSSFPVVRLSYTPPDPVQVFGVDQGMSHLALNLSPVPVTETPGKLDVVFFFDLNRTTQEERQLLMSTLRKFDSYCRSKDIDLRLGFLLVTSAGIAYSDLSVDTDRVLGEIQKKVQNNQSKWDLSLAFEEIAQYHFRPNVPGFVVFFSDASSEKLAEKFTFSSRDPWTVARGMMKRNLSWVSLSHFEPHLSYLDFLLPGFSMSPEEMEPYLLLDAAFEKILNAKSVEFDFSRQMEWENQPCLTFLLNDTLQYSYTFFDSYARNFLANVQISTVTANPPIVEPRGKVLLRCSVYPETGLEFAWECEHGRFEGNAQGPEVVWVAPEEPGSYSIQVSVSNQILTIPGQVVVEVYDLLQEPCP